VSSPRKVERREFWRQRIAEQEAGGQTVRTFCREHELSEHSYYWWRRQLSIGGEKAIRFALVETARPGGEILASRREHLDLVLHSGERLQIPADAATLRLVLSVLREIGQADR
jgi:transposase-like protein